MVSHYYPLKLFNWIIGVTLVMNCREINVYWPWSFVFSISARQSFSRWLLSNLLNSAIIDTPVSVCLWNWRDLCLNYLCQVINRHFSQIPNSATNSLIPFNRLHNSYIHIAWLAEKYHWIIEYCCLDHVCSVLLFVREFRQ